MRRPYWFVRGNLIFCRDAGDVWALYRLVGESYAGLSAQRKIALKEQIEGFAYAVESDFQLLRIGRSWSPESYAERALATLDSRPGHGHRERFTDYLDGHRRELELRGVVRPDIYLAVRLDGGTVSGAGSWLINAWHELERSVGLRDSAGLSEERLAEVERDEGQLFQRVYDYLDCERAQASDVEYLVRRSYLRGLGEPRLEEHFRPAAISVTGEDGQARFEPYEYDLLRLHDSRVEIEARGLKVESELGTSYQALLVGGALPEEVPFPSEAAELLYAPLDCGFAVDAVFSAEWIANREASQLSKKRKIDADQIATEEAVGTHGPSTEATERQYQARELEQRLGGSDRPPLLRAGMIVAIGAKNAEEREERVERLRRRFGRVELHRPLGEQHNLFLSALPGQAFSVPGYKEHLFPDQFGAMVPTAIAHAGSEVGPYVGHTLGEGRQPIQFDLSEACQQNRPPTVLLSGTLGSGKTMLLQLLLYQAFLQGSGPIVDVDPKGDHNLELLPGVAEELEVIELSDHETYRGLLDPLRIAPEGRQRDLAYSFLEAVLPEIPPEWRTELHLAIEQACERKARSCGEILAELKQGGEAAQALGRALEIHSRTGLVGLGFGHPGAEPPDVGGSQVVSLRIRGLSEMLPRAGTPRADFNEEERVAQALLHLLGAYGLRLTSEDRTRHACLALDEAWALLNDSVGRALCDRMSRMGRSLNITPIFATQAIGDAEELEPLVGTLFAFGVETESEASRALDLLRLDSDDATAIQRMLGYRQGACYLRDFDGRTVPMQVDPGEELLSALDTNPGKRSGPDPALGGEGLADPELEEDDASASAAD